jgi:predicted Fe-S protein YdhL (DUF1289 family)
MALHPFARDGIASPCVGICILNATRICRGCGRHIEEIAAWGGASEAERRAIVERARLRLEQAPDRLTGTDRR